jgi:hypothetical protein
MLATQVLWVIGNIAGCAPIEIFASQLATPAPLMSVTDASNKFTAAAPQTIENWILAQKRDPDFAALCTKIQHAATRDGLVIYAPPDSTPKTVVRSPPAPQNVPPWVRESPFYPRRGALLAYHAHRRQEVPEGLPRLRAR